MKNILAILLVLLLQINLFSQGYYGNKVAKNTAYAELSYAGKIMAATANFERYIGHTDYLTIYGKAAAGYWMINEEDGLLFPITIQTLLFNTPSHLELGFGLNIVQENLLDKYNLYPIVNAGYRVHSLDGGLVMRFNVYLSNGPFPGFSIGYSF